MKKVSFNHIGSLNLNFVYSFLLRIMMLVWSTSVALGWLPSHSDDSALVVLRSGFVFLTSEL